MPKMWAYRLSRWKNVAFMTYVYQLSQRFPNFMKNTLVKQAGKALGPDYDVATHFTPRYKPWEQRMCLVPDADLFEAIKSGRASVVTDHIDTFTGTAYGSNPDRNWKPISSSPRPASRCKPWAGSGLQSTDAR